MAADCPSKIMSSVDVIVPCYNYGHFLLECVRSVLTQVGPQVRVLILNDASPDNTAEIANDLARQDPRVTVIHHLGNKGHIATYNEGIESVSADYLLLLSADDYLLPGALQRATSLMDAHPELSFTFGPAIRLETHTGTSYLLCTLPCWRSERLLTGQKFIEVMGATNRIASPTVVVRTKIQKVVGGYRPDLPHAGDTEMWLRLAAHGWVGYINTPQAVYRGHNTCMSKSYMEKFLPDLEQRELLLHYFFSSYGRSLPNGDWLEQRATYRLGCHAVSFASGAFEKGDIATAEELKRFAVRISPHVRRSLPWVKFALKRMLGPHITRTWRRLRAGVSSRNLSAT